PPAAIARVCDYPTRRVTVAVASAGQPSFVSHRPAAYAFPRLNASDFESLLSPSPDLIYFGTLQQMSGQAKELTLRVLQASRQARRFYDVNLRPGCYDPKLLRKLIVHATILKLNDQEVKTISSMFG